MYFFDNGEPEEFYFFVRNFNTTLAASETLEAGTNFQYLRTLVHREALRQFDFLSTVVENTETLDVDYIIRGLAQYLPPVNYLSKQKRAMCRGMKKTCSLTVRCYAVRVIDLNEYLAYLPAATFTDKSE